MTRAANTTGAGALAPAPIGGVEHTPDPDVTVRLHGPVHVIAATYAAQYGIGG